MAQVLLLYVVISIIIAVVVLIIIVAVIVVPLPAFLLEVALVLRVEVIQLVEDLLVQVVEVPEGDKELTWEDLEQNEISPSNDKVIDLKNR